MFNLKAIIFVSSFVLIASNIYAGDLIARGGGGGGGERGGNRGGGEYHQNQNHNQNHLNQNQKQNLEEGSAIHSRQNQFSHYSPQFNEGTPNESNVQANQFRRATNQSINSINPGYMNRGGLYNGGYYNGAYGNGVYVVPEPQYQYPYQNNFIEAD